MTGDNTIIVKAGETLQRNVMLTVPLPANTTPSHAINPGDLVIPGLAIAVNLVAFAALLAILRRNWH